MSMPSLLRLMLLLSPSFPVGGFAYSSGLEQAAADGLVTDGTSLENWLQATLHGGALRNDAILLAMAHRGSGHAANELAIALAGSRQRHLETTAQGDAFVRAVKASALPCPEFADPVAYPVAIGAVAATQEIPAEDAIAAYLHAYVSNQIQCGIRLGVTGQNGGVVLLTRLEPLIADKAVQLANATEEDLGSNTILADISSLRHETLYSRIFRS